MSLGSEPAWAAPLGVARVLSDREVPPLGCECLRVSLAKLEEQDDEDDDDEEEDDTASSDGSEEGQFGAENSLH